MPRSHLRLVTTDGPAISVAPDLMDDLTGLLLGVHRLQRRGIAMRDLSGQQDLLVAMSQVAAASAKLALCYVKDLRESDGRSSAGG